MEFSFRIFRDALLGLFDLERFLRDPLTYKKAVASISQRLATRNDRFLKILKRYVYDYPSSPYLPLLRDARCEYGDIVDSIHKRGLSASLAQLKEAGVYLSFDEFKGKKRVRRNGADYLVNPRFMQSSSGTRMMSTRSSNTSGYSLEVGMRLHYLKERSCYESVMIEMLDLADVPFGIWYPALPASAGALGALRYAKIGRPIDQWFRTPLAGAQPGISTYLSSEILISTLRKQSAKFSRPHLVGNDQIEEILDWILTQKKKHGRCGFQSYATRVVRLAQAAVESGHSLHGVHFVVGGEPLTTAKKQTIIRSGADVCLRYMASEIGTIGVQCGTPAATDDQHLAADLVASISDGPKGENGKLFFTTLSEHAPLVLLNADLGDRGVLEKRECGCRFGELGLNTHISKIRSSAQVTCAGMALPIFLLNKISEEVLVAKYGGTTVDYQWVEEENENVRTKLFLHIDPSVGPLNEASVLADIASAIGKYGPGARIMAELWHQEQTIAIKRCKPICSGFGKQPALLRVH
jgi:hypothetical protein